MSDDEILARFAVEAVQIGPEECAKKLERMPRGRMREIFKRASFLTRYSSGPVKLLDAFEDTKPKMVHFDYAEIEKRFAQHYGGAR